MSRHACCVALCKRSVTRRGSFALVGLHAGYRSCGIPLPAPSAVRASSRAPLAPSREAVALPAFGAELRNGRPPKRRAHRHRAPARPSRSGRSGASRRDDRRSSEAVAPVRPPATLAPERRRKPELRCGPVSAWSAEEWRWRRAGRREDECGRDLNTGVVFGRSSRYCVTAGSRRRRPGPSRSFAFGRRRVGRVARRARRARRSRPNRD